MPQFEVDPYPLAAVRFTATNPDGTTATVYSDAALSTTVSLPTTVSALTVFYTASGARIAPVIKVGGVDITASNPGAEGTVRVDVNKAHAYEVAVDIPALAPTNVFAETLPRNGGLANQAPLASGTLYLCGINLPANAAVSTMTFVSQTQAAVAPTNWWFGLFDSSRVMLAVTADQTSTAWNATTRKTLNVATTAAGAATSFTTTYAGLHYIGIMVAAGTVPSLACGTTSTTVANVAPILVGSSTTGLTTPPAFPSTATAITVAAFVPYANVS